MICEVWKKTTIFGGMYFQRTEYCVWDLRFMGRKLLSYRGPEAILGNVFYIGEPQCPSHAWMCVVLFWSLGGEFYNNGRSGRKHRQHP